MTPLAAFDPFSADVVREPHAFYAALRREAPLYRLPNGAYYLMSRYRDVRDAALNVAVYSSNLVAVMMRGHEQRSGPELLALPSGTRTGAVDALAIADPPVHTHQRKLSNKAFSVRRVAALEPAIRALAESLVGATLPQNGTTWRAADFMRDVAVPLPMTVIARMIGLPHADIARLKRWSDAAVGLLSGMNTPTELAEHAGQVAQLAAYFGDRVDEAASAPGDNLLGDLVRASEGSETLTRDEVIAILLQILTAGNESTTSLIGSALRLLLENPAIEERLRADRTLVEPFIEEALRLESPFHGHFRLVRQNTEVAGHELPAGSRVMLLWGAANRDADEFPNPDAIDLSRGNAKGHLGFGVGLHHCIGAALARLETRVVLETILRRTRRMRRGEGEVSHIPSMLVRCLARLPVEFCA